MNEHQTLDSYLANLESAWQLAYQSTRQQIEANQIPTSLVDCFHNALIRSSLNTFAEDLTPKIVARLFETGLWTLEDILVLISLIPDHYRKAQNYVALLETEKLDHAAMINVREKALATAKSIDFPAYHSRITEAVSSYEQAEGQLNTLEQSVDAAIDYVDNILYSYTGNNGYELCKLIEKLPKEMLPQTEAKILALKNVEARAWTLAFLARRTEGDHQYRLLEEGLRAAAQIKQDVNKANALLQLASQISGDLVPIALDLALGIKEGDWRPRAVERLIDKLSKDQVKRVLDSMLMVEDDWWRADGIISVIEHSTGETQQKALTNLLSIEQGEPYSKMTGWLAGFTNTPANIEIAIQAAKKIKNDQQRSKMLDRLTPISEEKQAQSQTLNFPDLIDIRNQHITVNYTFQDRLENIFQIEWEEERAYALASFVQYIPDELIPLVIERSKKFLEWLHRDAVLDKLAPRLNGDILQSATQDVADYEDTTSLVYALKNLALLLPQPKQNEILEYALNQLLELSNRNWASENILKLRDALTGELRERATQNLPLNMQNTTYDQINAQQIVETAKRLEDDPETQKRIQEYIEAARAQYGVQLNPIPVSTEPQNPLLELLEDLSQARHKKRDAVFYSCMAITQFVDEKSLPSSIIPTVVDDILDIHQNWRWP